MKQFYTFLKYYKPYKITIILTLVIFVLVTVLEIASNLLFKYTIDTVIPKKDFTLLIYMILAFLVIDGSGLVFFFYTSIISSKLNLKVNMNLKQDLLAKLHRITHLGYMEHNQGYWFSRVQQDAAQLFSIFTDSLFTLLRSIIMVILCLAVLFYYNWLLTVLLLLIFPINMIFSNKLMNKISETTQANQIEITNRDSQLIESLSLLPYCVENSAENYNINCYKKSLLKQFSMAVKFYYADIKFRAFNIGFFEFMPLMILSVGAYSIILEKMTVGALLLFIMLSQQLLGSISQIFSLRAVFTQAKVNIKRVNEIFDLPEIDYKEVLLGFNSLHLKKVSFSYNEKVLSDVELLVNKGDKIAILGKSGSGKSTLLKLIMGLIKPEEGEIFYNNVSHNKVNYDLRNCFCAIWQDPLFFKTSPAENISLGTDKNVDPHLLNSLNIDFYDNETVGENGKSLSSGQKQRLSLLRGVVRATDVILLDEPTVNLDSANRKKVMDFIKSLPIEKTVIIVTHDDELSELCDKVYTLKDGILYG